MLMTDAKKKMMAKLKMPAKPSHETSLDDMDLGDEDTDPAGKPGSDTADYEGSADEEAMESPEEEKQEHEDGHESAELAHIPDDELLAEVKKRGLAKQLGEDGEEEESGHEDEHSIMA